MSEQGRSRGHGNYYVSTGDDQNGSSNHQLPDDSTVDPSAPQTELPHHDDNDVDALIMRLPSPIPNLQGDDDDGAAEAFQCQAGSGLDDQFPDLPPLRDSTANIYAAGNAAIQDARSRLISHDSWFLLFPPGTRNNNQQQPQTGDEGEENNIVDTIHRSSSDHIGQRSVFGSLRDSAKISDTSEDDEDETDTYEVRNTNSPIDDGIEIFHEEPPPPPRRARSSTYDGAAIPGRSDRRGRLSSCDASSLRHKLDRVSSTSGHSDMPVWTMRRGSLLHSNGARKSYMHTLVLKRQLKQQYSEIQHDARTAISHAETIDRQQEQSNQQSPTSATTLSAAVLLPSYSAVDKELLRQVESFEEDQAKLLHHHNSQKRLFMEGKDVEEGVEVMASSGVEDGAVLIENEHTHQMSSKSLHDSRIEGVLLAQAGEQKGLQQLAKQIIDEANVKEFSQKLREIHNLVKPYLKDGVSAEEAFLGSPFPLQVRIQNMSYKVKLAKEFGRSSGVEEEANRHSTYNIFGFVTYLISFVLKYLQRVVQCQPQVPRTLHGDLPRKEILKDINLVIEPGQNYLVLGPPGSGKSILLKAIAGLIPLQNPFSMEGSITYNGKSQQECAKDNFFIENAFGYIDQLDDHAPLMTVKETLNFAYQCKTGGKILLDKHEKRSNLDVKNTKSCDDDSDIEKATPRDRQELNLEMAKRALEDDLPLQIILTILGLTEVQDTFVGNATTERGVSGGQRRRVTVGEMIVSRTPILLGDEISTGLDAASTFDIVETLLYFGRLRNYSRVFSLLQPSPEVVSLFDQIILLSEGHILFAGKIEEVEEYFAHLGFRCPEFVDLADFLQLVSTEDRESLYQGGGKCPTVEDLAHHFTFVSQQGGEIQLLLNSPHENKLDIHGSVQTRNGGILQMDAVRHKYANGFFRSLTLITRRFLLLWVRDRKVLIFSVVRNIINGASVGGAFLNATDFLSIQGAMFQTGIFVLLGSLQTISGLVSERTIYDKQANASFYSAWPYVIGKSMSQIPQTFLLDTLVSGATLYYMIGLGGRTDFLNFLAYAVILFAFATLTNQQVCMIQYLAKNL